MMLLFPALLSNSLLLWIFACFLGSGHAWMGRHVCLQSQHQYQQQHRARATCLLKFSAPDSKEEEDDDKDAWDSDVDYESMLPKDPTKGKSQDPSLGWNVPKKETPPDKKSAGGKLGIDIGSFLAPLSKEEADDLKAAAAQVVNDAVAAGMDEIELVRAKMKLELQFEKDKMQRESERNAQEASSRLLGRIDDLTNAFLANTTLSRTSTKLAALADRRMEGRGIDMGSWGTLGGASIVTGMMADVEPTKPSFGSSPSQTSAKIAAAATTKATPRLLIVADTKDDVYAKQLIEPLTKALQEVVSSLEVQTIRPTETWPLGGSNAAAVLIFLTSLNDASTVKNGLERLLRQTMTASGKIAQPPTQIVAISTVGTSRTNQMPYSMQNLFGGKLEKRKQMEEAVQTYIQQQVDKTRPPYLDFTICKLGELKSDTTKDSLTVAPGDVLDGTIPVDAAVSVLKQAIALQSAARNATFCSVGGGASTSDMTQDDWDNLFLPLDGPEVWRTAELVPGAFDELVEYLQEWAELPATSQGLTTPIRIDTSPLRKQQQQQQLPNGVKQQVPLQLLFLPTATGARYMSRGEEKERERLPDTKPSSSSSSRVRTAREGGLEILVEETVKEGIRVRVRRCNYAPGVILKELTEQTLLSRIKKAMSVWLKDHLSQ